LNDLIKRCAAGDETAFAMLFEQTKNLVYKTALLMLDDPREAEDALQEVFIKVYRSVGSYDPDRAAFTTWLHRVTVNHCLNRHRKKRLTLVGLEDVTLGRRTHAIEQFGVDQEMRQALNRLSDKLRVVVVLRYFWDMPYAEIADILDIPIGTVKSRLHQALKNLRLDLEGVAQ
jgi:RNA polymerase sigma-70 factor (ECF subfamily)